MTSDGAAPPKASHCSSCLSTTFIQHGRSAIKQRTPLLQARFCGSPAEKLLDHQLTFGSHCSRTFFSATLIPILWVFPATIVDSYGYRQTSTIDPHSCSRLLARPACIVRFSSALWLTTIPFGSASCSSGFVVGRVACWPSVPVRLNP